MPSTSKQNFGIEKGGSKGSSEEKESVDSSTARPPAAVLGEGGSAELGRPPEQLGRAVPAPVASGDSQLPTSRTRSRKLKLSYVFDDEDPPESD